MRNFRRLCLLVSGIIRSITDAKEPILLKVVAPPSHTALSGDVTVFILDSETESSMVSTSTVSNDTKGIKTDETEKIDPKRDGVSAGHEPLVLRYVKKIIKLNDHARRRDALIITVYMHSLISEH